MTVIKLSSGDELEIKNGDIFLKKDGNYEQIQYIEDFVEILRIVEKMDIILKLDSICFEIEWEGGTERVPIFFLPLLCNPKKIVVDTGCGLYVLTPTKKFSEEFFPSILDSLSFAWSVVDSLYYIGRMVEYFVNPEIFSKYKIESEDVFDEFLSRLSELKSAADTLPKYIGPFSTEIYEIFDFFSELIEKLIEINSIRNMDISKIQIIQEILDCYEKIIEGLWFMVHVIFRLVFNQKLVSLQMFINCRDMMYSHVYGLISLTAKNVFSAELPKPKKDTVKRNLQLLISRGGKEGTFRVLRNNSPLSHGFKIVDVRPYTTESVAEILSPICESLYSLLDINITILKTRTETDSGLQEEMAENGVSVDDILSCISQLESILLIVKKFIPSEIVWRVERLKDLYLNIFLLLSFYDMAE